MNRVFMTLSAVLCICICGGCSVKEDRSDCPLDLHIDFAPCRGYGRDVVVTALGDSLLFRHYYYPGSSAEHAVYEVPHGNLTICAAVDNADCNRNWPYFAVNVGSEFDSLYACANSLPLTGSNLFHTIRLHKQFADIRIDMSELIPDAKRYDLMVKGDACGVNLVSLKPLKGEFGVAFPQSDPVVSVLVPRQHDSSLTLEVYDEGVLIDSYPIGEYLLEAGYDWEAEDLADASLRLETHEADISIQIRDWITGFVEDIVI